MFMPKTKFQDFIYTVIMVIVMVYGMVCYNTAINTGGLNNHIFLESLKELPIMGVIAFVLEFFIIGRLAKHLTFKLVDPKNDKPIIVTIIMSAIIVCLMCPIMSFIGSTLFGNTSASNIISNWLQAWVLSFPMALCYQLFYAGPLVRLIFRNLFKKQLKD